MSNWRAAGGPKYTREQRRGSNVAEKGNGAWYVISIAAVKADVHEQTLRHYERLGLISPARKGTSPHSPRLYSDLDIERVMHIRRLMRDLGVNLAGVEAILHMKDRMEQMQQELEQEMERMQARHVAETRRLKEIIERLQRGSS
ncbi:MAG TPA: MerR family transcriptional regulator [Ktedonobacteraceae bacterium]|nr:MerR family transcriptional regulator [Ktedonobacteraceae bacterium]